METKQSSQIKNLSQVRAQFAFEQVKAAKLRLDQKDIDAHKGKEGSPKMKGAKEFKSYVKNVPMMIRTNGLAAAYAFVFSRAKAENKSEAKDNYNAYHHIQAISQAWLIEQKVMDPALKGDFYKQLIDLSQPDYRRATRELLSLFTWLKRFADGLIENGGTDVN
jgi:CRISPR-associated protein Cmr5